MSRLLFECDRLVPCLQRVYYRNQSELQDSTPEALKRGRLKAKKRSRWAVYTASVTTFIVFISAFFRQFGGRRGNQESWICGGSAATPLQVVMVTIESMTLSGVVPLCVVNLILHQPRLNYLKTLATSGQRKRPSDAWVRQTNMDMEQKRCSLCPMRVCGRAVVQENDTLLGCILALCSCMAMVWARAIEVWGYDMIRWGPYMFLVAIVIVAFDSWKHGPRVKLPPSYAVIYVLLVSNTPYFIMSFLREVIVRARMMCAFSVEFDHTTSAIFVILALCMHALFLFTINVAEKAFGPRRRILYASVIRVMGDLFTALALMDVAPLSSQFFILALIKFIGRLSLDMDWPVDAGKAIFKLLCASMINNKARDKDVSAREHLVEKARKFEEQWELATVSLLSEGVGVSVILITLLAVEVNRPAFSPHSSAATTICISAYVDVRNVRKIERVPVAPCRCGCIIRSIVRFVRCAHYSGNVSI